MKRDPVALERLTEVRRLHHHDVHAGASYGGRDGRKRWPRAEKLLRITPSGVGVEAHVDNPQLATLIRQRYRHDREPK
jgi:hypothetical protein